MTSFRVSQSESEEVETGDLVINTSYTVLQYQYLVETRVYRILVKDPGDKCYTLHIDGACGSLYSKLSNMRYKLEQSNFSNNVASTLMQFTFCKTNISFKGNSSTHIIVQPDNSVTF